MKKIIFLLLLPILSLAQGLGNVDKIIAKVDNYYILQSEVMTLVQRSKENGQVVDKCQAFESLVIQKLMVAKAEIDSVIVEDAIIKNQLDARMQEMSRIYGSEKNIVAQFGKSVETLKSELKSQVREQLTAEKMRSTITEKMNVTPDEVAEFFNGIPTDSLPMIPAEVTLSQLVKLAKITKEQRGDIINKLNGIRQRIVAGESFADLAKEYSEDPGSGAQGGDLGFAKRGQMVGEFEATAMSQDSGAISSVIETEFGFHIIQTLEMRGQEYHARHILLRPDYARFDLTDSKKDLDSLRTVITADSIKFQKAVKLYSDDKNTNEAGGILMDPESGSYSLPLDLSMEPNLYLAVSSLKVNEITPPINYRTPDGKTGMRIVMVKAKKDEHKANLKDDFEKLKVYTLNQKQSKVIDKWFKAAIAEVYIKIDPEYESCNLFQQ
jgi:peptidyl-prolyl cis-trans isomerase SurA